MLIVPLITSNILHAPEVRHDLALCVLITNLPSVASRPFPHLTPTRFPALNMAFSGLPTTTGATTWSNSSSSSSSRQHTQCATAWRHALNNSLARRRGLAQPNTSCRQQPLQQQPQTSTVAAAYNRRRPEKGVQQQEQQRQELSRVASQQQQPAQTRQQRQDSSSPGGEEGVVLSNNIAPFSSSSATSRPGSPLQVAGAHDNQHPHADAPGTSQASAASAASTAAPAAPPAAAVSGSVMTDFLTAYGLQPSDIARLAHECPQLFATTPVDSSDSGYSEDSSSHSSVFCCHAGQWENLTWEEEEVSTGAAAAAAVVCDVHPQPHTGVDAAPAATAATAAAPSQAAAQAAAVDVYEVGRTLLFFHNLGWSHSSVLRRIVALYPQLLTKQVDRDILPVLRTLSDMGCSQADLQLLVWEFPRIFCSSNWRRHIRKFQYLGLYGLPPPGQYNKQQYNQQQGQGQQQGQQQGGDSGSDSSTDSSADSLERIMRWL